MPFIIYGVLGKKKRESSCRSHHGRVWTSGQGTCYKMNIELKSSPTEIAWYIRLLFFSPFFALLLWGFGTTAHAHTCLAVKATLALLVGWVCFPLGGVLAYLLVLSVIIDIDLNLVSNMVKKCHRNPTTTNSNYTIVVPESCPELSGNILLVVDKRKEHQENDRSDDSRTCCRWSPMAATN